MIVLHLFSDLVCNIGLMEFQINRDRAWWKKSPVLLGKFYPRHSLIFSLSIYPLELALMTSLVRKFSFGGVFLLKKTWVEVSGEVCLLCLQQDFGGTFETKLKTPRTHILEECLVNTVNNDFSFAVVLIFTELVTVLSPMQFTGISKLSGTWYPY